MTNIHQNINHINPNINQNIPINNNLKHPLQQNFLKNPIYMQMLE